jgi:hypothetical protein
MKTRRDQTQTGSLTPPLDARASVYLSVAIPTAESSANDVASDIRHCAKQLPDRSSLPPGAWVAVQLAPERHGLLGRALGKAKYRQLRRAVCCTALLAAGYEHICVDENDHAFGRVPLR